MYSQVEIEIEEGTLEGYVFQFDALGNHLPGEDPGHAKVKV